MIRRNILRRLEQIEASMLPDERNILKITVTTPGGIIGEVYLGPGANTKTSWLDLNPTASKRRTETAKARYR